MKNIEGIINTLHELKDMKNIDEAQLINRCFSAGIDLQKFKPQQAGDLRKKTLKAREDLLGYLIQSQMIVNFSAPSGICKSWLAMYLCMVIATAGECFGLKAPKARKVVYLDAEMPEVDAKNRIENFSMGLSGHELELFDSNFTIINVDGTEQELPDLTTELGQHIVSHHSKSADVLVIDNYISVFPETDDKDTIKIKQFTNWLRQLRASGLTIITINHTTKDLKRLGSVVLDTFNDLTVDIREPEVKKGQPKKDFLLWIFSKARHLTAEQKNTINFKFSINEDGVNFWRVFPN